MKADADAAIEAFGKNEQVKRVFWTLFVAMAGLVLARVVDQSDGAAGGWGDYGDGGMRVTKRTRSVYPPFLIVFLIPQSLITLPVIFHPLLRSSSAGAPSTAPARGCTAARNRLYPHPEAERPALFDQHSCHFSRKR